MGIGTRLVASVVFMFAVIAVMFGSALISAEGTFNQFVTIQAMCFGVAILALAFIIFNLRARLIVPLQSLRDYSSRIGKGDLSAVASGNYTAELGELHRSMGAMVTNLTKTAQDATEAHREAQAKADEVRQALEKATENETRVAALMENMRTAASKAQGVSQHIFTAVEELSSRVEDVNQGVEVQRDRMTETATAMEEMTSTVMEVARNASQAAQSADNSRENAVTGAEGVHQAVSAINNISQRFDTLKETMAGLGQQADNIGKVMTVINDIADQTNLLALNAAIEAARAGDAGRGFAVVADEVRKLAEKTMAATKEVGAAVHEIQAKAQENIEAVEIAAGDILVSTEAANKSGVFMEEIVGFVEDTAGQVASIATASEEQSAVSEQINRAVLEVTNVAQNTAKGMHMSSEALVEISGLAEELDTIIQSMAQGRLEEVVSSDKLITWTDSLSVNIRSIDAQHKRLVDLINELHAAMRQRKSDRVLLDVVERLKDYTVTHFQAEERYFDKYGYPATEAHKKQHTIFVQQVADFEAELKAGTAKVTMDIMRFLKDWLVNHIQGTDQKYSKFLNGKGLY
ncbi:MAG: bacteriohemerythrin [Desulfovibrio sp.]|uniref:bacteriohemerythrin n=1 Tax=Desulfovibrio sp. 7SRBS1 TaxID=3378064 RepID=UPI003B4178C4